MTLSQPLNDGQWHHVCITWDNTDGATKTFVFASLVRYKTFGVNEVISGPAKFVVGQTQGSFGGNFDVSKSFIGELTQMNMWSYALDENSISRMARYCEHNVGDVVAWSALKAHTHGNVTIVPSRCPTTPGTKSEFSA